MKPWLHCTRLAALIGLAWCAGTLRAQDPPPPVPTTTGPATVYGHTIVEGTLVPQAVEPPAGGCGCGGGNGDDGAGEKKVNKGPVHTWLRKHGVGCYAHFNNYSCSSLKSEGAFLFGSCRTFFGEPCFLGPTPPPIPP